MKFELFDFLAIAFSFQVKLFYKGKHFLIISIIIHVYN